MIKIAVKLKVKLHRQYIYMVWVSLCMHLTRVQNVWVIGGCIHSYRAVNIAPTARGALSGGPVCIRRLPLRL